MDTRTGKLYPDVNTALAHGVDPLFVAEITGADEAVAEASAAVRVLAGEAEDMQAARAAAMAELRSINRDERRRRAQTRKRGH